MVKKLKGIIKIIRTFILIAVVGLLLNLTLLKPVDAELSADKVIGVIVITDGKAEFVQVQMNTTQVKILIKNIGDFEDWLEENNPLSDLQLDENEKIQIRLYIVNIIGNLPKGMQFIDPDDLIELITPINNSGSGQSKPCDHGWMNLRNSIISVGSLGFSVIPFYKYEAFIRIGIPLFRGIHTLYIRGHTTFIRVIPPDMRFGDKSGIHLVSVKGLRGLYINIGNLGADYRIFGPVVLLGRAYVSATGGD